MSNKNRFFEIAILMEGGMGVLAVLIGLPFGLRFGDIFFVDFEAIFWGITATIPTIIFYFFLCSLPLAGLRRVRDLVRRIFRDEMLSLPLWKLAVLALAAGVGEEFLFRGLLQELSCNLLPNNELEMIFFVSIVFGLFHFLSKTYVVLAFLLSFYLGLLFSWTDNLFVPVIVHALYDFFVFFHLRIECSRTP